MGVYFNPNNESFTKDRNYKIYIDKTGLLEYLNEALGTPKNCIAVSHARRFGKSHAAGMVDAYYSLGCDSTKLFEDTKIANNADWKKHMNRYNVIHLDISSVWDFHKEDLIESIHDRVCDDFQKIYGEELRYEKDLYLLIQEIYAKTGIPLKHSVRHYKDKFIKILQKIYFVYLFFRVSGTTVQPEPLGS